MKATKKMRGRHELDFCAKGLKEGFHHVTLYAATKLEKVNVRRALARTNRFMFRIPGKSRGNGWYAWTTANFDYFYRREVLRRWKIAYRNVAYYNRRIRN